MNKDTFCNYCGTILNQDSYPKTCLGCDKVIYNNPLPVSVTALFCVDEESVKPFKKYGIIVVKRNIEPKRGEWALPGGFLEQGETWQEGAAREVAEEVGLDLDSNEFKLLTVETATNGNLLIFNYYNNIVSLKDIQFEPNDEVSELKVISSPEPLAFPTHTTKIDELLGILTQIISGI